MKNFTLVILTFRIFLHVREKNYFKFKEGFFVSSTVIAEYIIFLLFLHTTDDD